MLDIESKVTLANYIRSRIKSSGPVEKNDLLEVAANELDRLRRVLDDVDASVIAAGAVAYHGTPAKRILDEAYEAMKARKTGSTPNVELSGAARLLAQLRSNAGLDRIATECRYAFCSMILGMAGKPRAASVSN